MIFKVSAAEPVPCVCRTLRQDLRFGTEAVFVKIYIPGRGTRQPCDENICAGFGKSRYRSSQIKNLRTWKNRILQNMMKKQEFRGIFGGFRRFSGTRILRTNASVPKHAWKIMCGKGKLWGRQVSRDENKSIFCFCTENCRDSNG